MNDVERDDSCDSRWHRVESKRHAEFTECRNERNQCRFMSRHGHGTDGTVARSGHSANFDRELPARGIDRNALGKILTPHRQRPLTWISHALMFA